MKISSYNSWIDEGYNQFALNGPSGIVVEIIAAKLSISKSTFYHHFGDIEYFTGILLEEHVERAKQLAKEAAYLTSFVPGFPGLLVKFKTDILFHKQLRLQRENKLFQQFQQKAVEPVMHAIQPLWSVFIGADADVEKSRKLFLIIEDMFYQRTTTGNFTVEWMETLSYELKDVVQSFSGR